MPDAKSAPGKIVNTGNWKFHPRYRFLLFRRDFRRFFVLARRFAVVAFVWTRVYTVRKLYVAFVLFRE